MSSAERSRSARLHALRPPNDPSAIVLVVSGSIAPADIPSLCECVGELLEGSEAEVVICDMAGIVDPDAVTLDALVRLQLTARRLGRRIRLRCPCGGLGDLIAFAGLDDVVPLCAQLPLETRGEPEEREQARGVEKEGDPADPSV